MRKKYKAKAAAADQRRQATSDAIASVTSGGKRSRITDYLETNEAAGKCDAHEVLALMLAGCRIPERVAEHPLFINAVCAIRDAGTGYVLPRRGFIGEAGLRLCCENIDRGLVRVKARWKRTSVTVSSDMMTDKNGRPQANVFLVNDSGAVFKESVDGRMETKTGGYVASILRPMVEEVGSENAGPHIQHMPCATHVLDFSWKTSSLAQMLVSDVWKGWEIGERKKAAEKFAAQVLDAAWWRTAEFFCKLMKLPFMAMRKTYVDAKGMMGRMYDVMLKLTEDVVAVVEEDEEQLSYSDKHSEHLSNHGKEGDDGNDSGEVLMELQDEWHGTDAPKLAALAIRTLSQPVSASPCEKGWSTWDGVHTARRNKLGSAKCRNLVFVAHNWHSCEDVMPGVVLGNMLEPPVPEGYNVVEGDEEEEEGEDILEDEYE
ncbi:unnamed protein product [Closterium sp. Yama58-4]|nr:unnamed protein product [Closterium sp. Yama58-4]